MTRGQVSVAGQGKRGSDLRESVISVCLSTAHLLTGPLAGVLTLLVLLMGTLLTGGRRQRTVGRVALAVQRSRFAAFLGVRLAPSPAGPSQQLLYALATIPTSLVCFLAGVLTWLAGPGLCAAAIREWWSSGEDGWALLTGGVVVLCVAPWGIERICAGEVAVARWLLRTEDSWRLAKRVESLTASRSDAMAAAAAERRRIERDLHDGTQQRLVSLAIHLGVTRASSSDLPEPTRHAIEKAHDEAKQALVELRDLVRGLHPVVLDELGLDAALSGVTARCPVPVRLSTDLPEPLPQPVEQVAYFVVSEALTNAAKHSQATSVEVTVRDVPRTGRLRLTVRDNGRGGARLVCGGGLRGLEQRVGSVDGTLVLTSPAGGPTVLEVELPCEWS